MNIFIHEIKSNLKSLIIWSLCIVAIVVMMMSEFSAYYNNPEMADILDMVPQQLLDALSMGGTNITTVSGFVTVASIYFYIMLSIYSVLLGSSILSKEERDKTAEFFMVLPISRGKVILSKWSASVFLSVLVNAVTMAAVFATTMNYDKVVDFTRFMFLMMGAIFIIQVMFLSFGMLMAAMVKRYKKSGTYAISVLMVLYFISIIMSFSEKLDFLKYVTPFRYFEAVTILSDMNLNTGNLVISFLVIILCLGGTLYFYPKRDLNI